MILNITLNPLLEKRYFVEKINHGKTHRISEHSFTVGGKGINISRQLDKLGVGNLSIIPLGGQTGKIYRREIEREKINFTAISVKSEIRLGTVIVENKKSVTSFIESGNSLSREDIKKIKEKIDKMIENASSVVFAGSIPNKEAAEIICYGIEKGNELDKITVLDTYGEHLEKCISAAPMVIHNNFDEIKSSLNLSLDSENDITEYLKSLYRNGVKIAVVTNGKNPAYALKFGYLYKIIPPSVEELDSTGSGDSFLAGIIYGLEKDALFTDTLKTASALCSANAAKLSVASVDESEMKALIDSVKVEEIGDKMKVIDDSPRY